MKKLKKNDINLYDTITCGQIFRFIEDGNNYIIVVKDRVISLKQEEDLIIVESSKEEGLEERHLHLEQWFPYKERETLPPAEESLSIILDYLKSHNLNELHATTALMIAPSCKINIAKALITNFHQPKSTLLLLVSALIGERWKEAYQYALDNNFRFLSYGDSCLFIN